MLLFADRLLACEAQARIRGRLAHELRRPAPTDCRGAGAAHDAVALIGKVAGPATGARLKHPL